MPTLTPGQVAAAVTTATLEADVTAQERGPNITVTVTPRQGALLYRDDSEFEVSGFKDEAQNRIRDAVTEWDRRINSGDLSPTQIRGVNAGRRSVNARYDIELPLLWNPATLERIINRSTEGVRAAVSIGRQTGTVRISASGTSQVSFTGAVPEVSSDQGPIAAVREWLTEYDDTVNLRDIHPQEIDTDRSEVQAEFGISLPVLGIFENPTGNGQTSGQASGVSSKQIEQTIRETIKELGGNRGGEELAAERRREVEAIGRVTSFLNLHPDAVGLLRYAANAGANGSVFSRQDVRAVTPALKDSWREIVNAGLVERTNEGFKLAIPAAAITAGIREFNSTESAFDGQGTR